MTGIHEVEARQVQLVRLAPVIGEERATALQEMAAIARKELAGATVWTVNADVAGAGVTELIRSLAGYTVDVGVDVRWCVASTDPRFAATSGHLHRQLHGVAAAGEISDADADHYAEVTDALGTELATMVQPGDVVLLHDAPTAGLTPRLAMAGAHVIWRCHVGADEPNELSEAAWKFLQPHLEFCQGFIFSRRAYAPDWLPDSSVTVIPPSIDPFSPKNYELTATEIPAVLRDAGILARGSVRKRFTRPGGSPATISHQATVVREEGPLDAAVPLVAQVSRWDRLKDMAGVMEGFVAATLPEVDAHLALVGPAPSESAADGEAAEVLGECIAAWQALPAEARRHVSIVSLPMDDVDENAVIVNAVQRHAAVVVQKSIAEGFGLTVAEGMWKARPVVASRVGGIADQVVDGTGVLLDDPSDTAACGRAVARLLQDPAGAGALGEAARDRVLSDFVGDQHLAAYARLMAELHLRPH